MGTLGKLVGAVGPDRTLPERVALFAAAASVGSSFEPGLQPRKTIDQAIATGLISAVTLSAVTVTQSGIESVGRGLTRGRTDNASALARLLFSVGTNVVVGAAAYGLARALPPNEAEKSRRGLLRTAAQGTARVATVGAALSTAIGTLDLLAESAPQTRWVSRIPVALPAGIAISAWKIHRVHVKASQANDTTIADVSTRNSVGIAIGVGAGVLALQAGERVIAHGVARGLARIAPAYDVVSTPIGHVVSLAVLGAGMYAGYEYAVRRVENGAAAVEPAYDSPPTSPLVSGGPGSPVTFESLSREGRRFVNMALTQDEIGTVMGEPAVADPIRLFVGLDSAPLMDDRVDLLLDEMVRTKAFERKVVCLVSPTGSGYINYVMAESLEYLTRGDCAIVTMQYSLLPSSMSLTRTRLAVDQNRAIMHAISGYLRGMDPAKRPRFVAFGESLGALTMQDIWAHRSVEAMERDFIHSSLYVGTPSATQFAHQWRISPEKVDPQGKLIELDNFGDFLDLPADRQQVIRHVLVSHNDDPIPKFGTNLLMRRPWWLGPAALRPPRVPKSAEWAPWTTFVLTAVDLLNAMEVVPGTFGRRGHDYREDIPRFVSQAYDLPITADQLLTMERALRERELVWAQKRVVTEQVARAREAVMREVKTWNVNGSGTDNTDELLRRVLESAPSA